MQIHENAKRKLEAAIKAEDTARIVASNAARTIFKMGRERNIAEWENYQAALKIYEDARLEREAAYKAEKVTRRAVRSAFSEAQRIARRIVGGAGSTQE